uniref:Solute carrier family 19 member 1 n=1 Tax=Anas platyrhynchos TaxID=8839 RepID=A0A8B9TVH9_ANAPL
MGMGGGSSGVSGSEGVRRGSPLPRSAGPTPGCRGNAVFLPQQGAWPGAQGPNSSRGVAPAPRSASFRAPQVTNEITPVLSYSYVAVLVPIFLLTDYLRYKPVLVLQSLSHISIWLLLVLGTSVLAMQLMEFFYGVTMAARIAYSSYIFSLVAPSRYQRMASYSRTAVLLGVFTSSVLGQLCVTLGSVPFLTLNYVSLGFVTFGLLLTLFLERPKRSLFFNRPEGACNGAAAPTELDKMAGGDGEGAQGGWRDMVLCRMLREVCALAKQSQLQLWSCWWVFNSAGYYLVLYYVQILWNEIYPAKDNRRVYNGGVDAASTLLGRLCSWGNCGSGWGGSPSVLGKAVVTLLHAVQYPGGGLRARCRSSSLWGGSSRCPLCVSPPPKTGAIASFVAGHVKIRWALWSALVIGLVTAVQAGLLMLMNTTSNIWLCYAAYVLFRGSYQFLVPIAIFQIATSLSKELCALVFGVNTFFGTVLKTIITIIVADKRGLGLSVHPQFYVYFGYFMLLAAAYLMVAVAVGVRHSRRAQPPEPVPATAAVREKSPEADCHGSLSVNTQLGRTDGELDGQTDGQTGSLGTAPGPWQRVRAR